MRNSTTAQAQAHAHSAAVNPTVAPPVISIGILDGKLYTRTDCLDALAATTKQVADLGHADAAYLCSVYAVRLARLIEQTEDQDAIARMDDEGAAR